MLKILIAAIFLIIPISAIAQTKPVVPLPNPEWRIPAPVKGNLIVYRIGLTQCSMFISDEGMAKGTVAPSCVLLPSHEVPEGGFGFEILDVISTTDD